MAKLLKALSDLRKKQKLYAGEVNITNSKDEFIFTNSNNKRKVELKIKLGSKGKDSLSLRLYKTGEAKVEVIL